MRLKSAYKDWRRRRQLASAGIAAEPVPGIELGGARSGVYAVDPTALGPHSIVCSVGIGDNIAWDLWLIGRFGCTVHAFDPTPRACAFLAGQVLPRRFVHHEVGLAARDGEQAFAAPRREAGVDYRPLPDGEAGLRLPVRRLATLLRELDFDRVDLLKLDIEGGEYEVLDDLLHHGPLPQQLLVEFHHGATGIPLQRTLAAVAALRRAGYAPFWISRRGLEFSFARKAATAP